MQILTRITQIPRYALIVGAVIVVAAGLVVFHAFTKSAAPAADTQAQMSQVRVETVAKLAAAVGPLPLTGTVTSLSQATVLSQTSGQITTLSRSLGDYVSAGTIIATFENASQQAAVQQAEGAYDAALAALARVTGSSGQNTTNSSLAALQSAYAAIDNAVHVRADALFTNPKTDPELITVVPDNTLVAKLKSERLALEATVADAQAIAQATNNVAANTEKMRTDLNAVTSFLDDLIKAVNETPPSQNASASDLGTYKTSLAAARTEVVTALTSITTAKSAYDANDVAAAEASVKQAQGALNAAKANLEKTIVRSPVSGTIVSLPVTQGDYVSTNAIVAKVSNPHALYIDTNVTPDDATTLSVGNKALIDGSIPGIITFVASALDPSTGKIEVKVGISGSAASLVDGEVVTLELSRAATVRASSQNALTIPITAAKILPSGPAVFLVTASSTLQAHAVELGTILGNRVSVRSGLTPDMRIVVDARGLAAGQSVLIASSTAQ